MTGSGSGSRGCDGRLKRPALVLGSRAWMSNSGSRGANSVRQGRAVQCKRCAGQRQSDAPKRGNGMESPRQREGRLRPATLPAPLCGGLPHLDHSCHVQEIVNVPKAPFLSPQMPRQTSLQPSAPQGAAHIEIVPWWTAVHPQPAHRQRHLPLQLHQQPIRASPHRCLPILIVPLLYAPSMLVLLPSGAAHIKEKGPVQGARLDGVTSAALPCIRRMTLAAKGLVLPSSEMLRRKWHPLDAPRLSMTLWKAPFDFAQAL